MQLTLISKISLFLIFFTLLFFVIDAIQFKQHRNKEITIIKEEFILEHLELQGKMLVSKNSQYKYSYFFNNKEYSFYEEYDKYNINDRLIVSFGLTNYLNRIVFFGIVNKI